MLLDDDKDNDGNENNDSDDDNARPYIVDTGTDVVKGGNISGDKTTPDRPKKSKD